MTALNVTRDNFDEVVLQGSGQRPVLVDFWAPWCGPCRTLAPILDRIAAEYEGRLTLVKLNTEDEPELAGTYGVRSIPNCKVFVDGNVVDEFTGALPERAIRDFLAGALPSPAAPLVATAKALLAEGDPDAALTRLDDARALDAQDEDLLLTRIEALLGASRAADANALLGEIEASRRTVRDERRLAALKARAVFAGDAGTDLATLARQAAAAPADCAAKLAYARALAAGGDYERALAELLAIVRTDRKFGDDIGRKTMLTVFAALPGDGDLVRRYRRELAGALN
jgi:putative thioredoxin